MKIRNGFVSNSSSSSFIVSGTDIKEIATSMLDIVVEDFSEWNENSKERLKIYGKWQKNLQTIFKLNNKDILEGKIGVCFPSTNYDTYILLKDEDIIHVDTCNNHSWDLNTWRELDCNEIEGMNDFLYFDVAINKLRKKLDYYIHDHNNKTKIVKTCSCDIYTYYHDAKDYPICPECGKKIKIVEK